MTSMIGMALASMGRGEPRVIAAVFVLFLGGVSFVAQRSVDEGRRIRAAHEHKWRDATVVRICPDGTRVWRLRDGVHALSDGAVVAGDLKNFC